MEENMNHHHSDKAHVYIGRLYLKAKEYSKAIENFDAALSINPEAGDAKQGVADTERAINGGAEDEGEDDDAPDGESDDMQGDEEDEDASIPDDGDL